MYECDWCGKRTDELWTVPGEYGKNESVCNDCVPKPPAYDITGEYHLRCPRCKSIKCQEVSERYHLSRPGGLFECEHSHLFTIIKIAEEVCITSDHRPQDLRDLDVTCDDNVSCPVCSSANHGIVRTKRKNPPHPQLLFECDNGHLFEVCTLTEEVWITDD